MGIHGGLQRIRMAEHCEDLLKSVATILTRRLTNAKCGNGSASFLDLLVWETETWYALIRDEGRLLPPVRRPIGALLFLLSGRPFGSIGRPRNLRRYQAENTYLFPGGSDLCLGITESSGS